MTVESIDMQSVIDIAFVLLVAFVCGRSLLASSNGGEARRSRWKDELEALQVGLKELIAEAGAASSRLDRSLQRRRSELETLLTKLEAAESRATANADFVTESPGSPDDAFPNETWCRPGDEGTGNGSASRQSTAAPSLKKEPGTGAGEGPSLQGYTRSKVPPVSSLLSSSGSQFTGEEMNPVVEAVQKSMESAQRIASAGTPSPFTREAPFVREEEVTQKTEEELDEEELLAQQTFEQTSIMDLVTYRIARRLLDAGKELHVVARKVDLPVSEIRLLDQLMREEARIKESRRKPVIDSAPDDALDDTLRLGEPLPKKKPQIVGPQRAEKEFTPGKFGRILHEERAEERRADIELQQEVDGGTPSRNLDEDIERELALL